MELYNTLTRSVNRLEVAFTQVDKLSFNISVPFCALVNLDPLISYSSMSYVHSENGLALFRVEHVTKLSMFYDSNCTVI